LVVIDSPQSRWERDLTQDGDVESNPGPEWTSLGDGPDGPIIEFDPGYEADLEDSLSSICVVTGMHLVADNPLYEEPRVALEVNQSGSGTLPTDNPGLSLNFGSRLARSRSFPMPAKHDAAADFVSTLAATLLATWVELALLDYVVEMYSAYEDVVVAWYCCLGVVFLGVCATFRKFFIRTGTVRSLARFLDRVLDPLPVETGRATNQMMPLTPPTSPPKGTLRGLGAPWPDNSKLEKDALAPLAFLSEHAQWQRNKIVRELYRTFQEAGALVDPEARDVVNLCIAIASLIHDHSATNITIVVSWVLNNTKTKASEQVHDIIKTMMDSLIKTEFNEADEIDLPVFDALSTPFFSKLRELIGMLSITSVLARLGLVPGELMGAWAMVKDVLRKDVTLDTFWLHLLGVIKAAFQLGADCIRMRSLKPLFHDCAWSMERFVDVATTLMYAHIIRKGPGAYGEDELREQIKLGRIDPWFGAQLWPSQRLDAGRYLLGIALDMEKTWVGRSVSEQAMYVSFRQTSRDLKSWIMKMENEVVDGQYRLTPLAIYVYGVPGCGKSAANNDIYKAVCKALEVEFCPSSVAKYIPGANFQDNFKANTLHCLMDDVDQGILKEGTTPNYATDVIDYVNTAAHKLESAAVEAKGTNTCSLRSLLFISNQEVPRDLSSRISTAGAFLRRFHIKIKVEANPACATATGAINVNTASSVKSANMFSVYVLDPEATAEGTYKLVEGMACVSKISLLEYIQAHARRHFAEQKAMLARLNDESSPCPKCGISLASHDGECGTVTVVDQTRANAAAKVLTPPVTAANAQPGSGPKKKGPGPQTGVVLANPVPGVAAPAAPAAPGPEPEAIVIKTEPGSVERITLREPADVPVEAGPHVNQGRYITADEEHHVAFAVLAVITMWWFPVFAYVLAVAAYIVTYHSSKFEFLGAAQEHILVAVAVKTMSLKEMFLAGVYFKCVSPHRTFKAFSAIRRQALFSAAASYSPYFAAGVGVSAMALIMYMKYSHDRTKELKKAAEAATPEEAAGDNQYLMTPLINPDLAIGNKASAFISVKREASLHPFAVEEYLKRTKTVTLETLVTVLAARIYKLQRADTGGSPHALNIASHVLLFPAHFFDHDVLCDGRKVVLPKEGAIDLLVEKVGGTHRSAIKLPFERVRKIPGRDLVVAYFPHLFPVPKDLSLSPTSLVATTKRFDRGVLVKFEEGVVTVAESSCEPYFARPSKCDDGNPMVYSVVPTSAGDCGFPLLCVMKTSLIVAGMHVMRTDDNAEGKSASEQLVGTEIWPEVEFLRGRFAINQVLVTTAALKKSHYMAQASVESVDDEPVELKEMPTKRSSYLAAVEWADVTNHPPPVEAVGTIVGYKASRHLKSAILHSRLGSYGDMLEEIFGVRTHYVIPEFRGRKVPFPGDESRELWTDPFVVNFKAYVNENGDPRIWDLACKDYLHGFDELPCREEIRPLTDAEVVFGVPGKIKPMNRKTSAGMPHAGPKSRLIGHSVDGQGDVFKPMLYHMSWYVDAWCSGHVTPLFCTHTQKDEVISAEKNAASRVRIFNLVSVEPNGALKKLVSPLLVLIMKFPYLSECFGGMNILGEDIDHLMQWFDAIDPERVRRIAGDYSWFDIRQCTEGMLRTADVFAALASMCAYTPSEVVGVRCGILSCLYTYRIVSGDVVAMSFSNPSGTQTTLGVNSITNSLNLRYAWYSRKLKNGLTFPEAEAAIATGDVFRNYVRVATTGDDNAGATSASAGLDQRVLAEELAAIGHTYTDTKKSATTERFSGPEDFTFLKRTPWYDSSIRRWKAKLDAKTFVRMVKFIKPSDASCAVSDQEQSIVRTLAGEVYLWGREKYAASAAAWAAFQESGAIPWRYDWPSYEYWEAKYVGGELAPWEVEDWDLPVETGVHRNQSGHELGMGPTVTTDVNSAPQVAETPAAPELMAHSVTAGSGLSQFVHRVVLTAVGAFASTDTFGLRVATVNDVGGTWASNLAIAEKIKHFQLIRAGFEVTITVQANAYSQGLYVATAVPLEAGGMEHSSLPDSKSYNAANAFQGPHALINLAESNSAVLPCPFFSEYNYWDRIDGSGNPGWQVVIFCLAPLKNVNDPALAPTAQFNIYTRAVEEGFELAVPTNEVKVKKHSFAKVQTGPVSSALGRARGVAAALAMVPALSGVATVAGTGLSIAQTVADALGWTKTQAENDPKAMRVAHLSNTATTDGEFSGNMVALAGGNNVTIDPRLGGITSTEEDTYFEDLFKRQTLVETFYWTPSQVRGTCVVSIPVTPGRCFALGGDQHQPTVPGAVGLPFTYWCGAMEYEIVLAASIFQKGVLQVVWSPDIDPPSALVMNLYNGHVFDLDSERTTCFSVGWASNKCVLEHRMRLAVPVPSTEANGYIHILVNIPLSSPSTQGVAGFVLASGGPDLQFTVPRVLAAGTENAFRTGMSLVNQTQLGDGYMECDTCDLVGAPSGVALGNVLAGERVGSVRALMQKFSWVFTFDSGGAGTANTWNRTHLHFPFYPTPPNAAFKGFYTTHPGETAAQARFTWLGYYSSFYAGLRGSMRLAMAGFSPQYNPHSGVGLTTVSQWIGSATSLTSTALAATTLEGTPSDTHLRHLVGLDMPGNVVFSEEMFNRGNQWTFPNYDTVKFRNNYHRRPTSIADPRNKWACVEFVWEKHDTTGGFAAMMFQAGGADITPIYFLRAFPIVTYQTS